MIPEITRRQAIEAVAAALSRGIAPDPDVDPMRWGSDYLVVADGPGAGSRWNPELTPPLMEILQCLSPAHPCNRVSVRKSSQVGFTGAAIVWIGSIIDATPAKSMVVFPTINVVQDFNREKLAPTIDATPRLKSKVRDQKSRSSGGSTALHKKFDGGSLVLTGANSSADLRSKTVKYAFADEIDDWPLDLDGQGDPMEMLDARQISFHATGEYKKLEGSTPTIAGASRIDAAFDAGDQRYYHVPCPHCGHYQRLVFDNLKFDKIYPFNARYACCSCGTLIDHHYKRSMVISGRWIASAPGAGRHPSFHVDALTSLLTTWDKIAEKFLSAKDDPQKLKGFVNLWLGQSWEERGDSPEWDRLFSRREDYPRCSIPIGGLLLTTAVDVQANGVFYEVVAWGPGKTSWSIDAGFLEGETADPGNPVWQSLTAIYERRYRDCYGNDWPVDLMGIDSGFNTGAVYHWVRGKPKAMALKGIPGWYAPPLGTPSKQDVTFGGKKLRRGLLLWPVGTWPLKSELYANLRKPGLRDGAEGDPDGYCHFSQFHDEKYFRQLTAEYLKAREIKGRMVREWVANGDNHFHDCRIYNMALADHLGVSRMTSDDWSALAALRNVPPARPQGNLFDASGSKPVPPPPQETPPSVAPSGGGFLTTRRPTRGWLRR